MLKRNQRIPPDQDYRYYDQLQTATRPYEFPDSPFGTHLNKFFQLNCQHLKIIVTSVFMHSSNLGHDNNVGYRLMHQIVMLDFFFCAESDSVKHAQIMVNSFMFKSSLAGDLITILFHTVAHHGIINQKCTFSQI